MWDGGLQKKAVFSEVYSKETQIPHLQKDTTVQSSGKGGFWGETKQNTHKRALTKDLKQTSTRRKRGWNGTERLLVEVW